jgi:hypothetical protein
MDQTTKALIRLADTQGVAGHAASELHTLLTVYGPQIPAAVAESMAKLQVSLASVAKEV